MSEYPSALVFADEDQLCEYMGNLNEAGLDATTTGVDSAGRSFMAYMWGPDADCRIMWGHPRDGEVDWGTERCPECHCLLDHFPIGDATYPVVVLTAAPDVYVPVRKRLEQPPPPDELAEILGEENP